MRSTPLQRTLAVVVAMACGCAIQSAHAAMAELTYFAQQGEVYNGDLLLTDSGAPLLPGLEGQIFEQLMTYAPDITQVANMVTINWDDETEYFLGLDAVTTEQQHSAKTSERIEWVFTSNEWFQSGSSVDYAEISTSLTENTPMFVPLDYVDPPDESYLTPEEIEELMMSGALDLLREYIDPNYSFADLTREQLAADLGQVENILAGIPEPQTYLLMLAGLGLVGWVARHRHV